MREYNGACNNKIRGAFKSLNTYFIIILIVVGSSVITFLINLAIESVANNIWNPYGNVIPSYIGIVLFVVLIVSIFAIMAIRSLKKEVCKNDGFKYSLFGGT